LKKGGQMLNCVDHDVFKKNCLNLLQKRRKKQLFEKKRGIVKDKHYELVLSIVRHLMVYHECCCYNYDTPQKEITKSFIKTVNKNIQALSKKSTNN
jgi:hypothetical protein